MQNEEEFVGQNTDDAHLNHASDADRAVAAMTPELESSDQQPIRDGLARSDTHAGISLTRAGDRFQPDAQEACVASSEFADQAIIAPNSGRDLPDLQSNASGAERLAVPMRSLPRSRKSRVGHSASDAPQASSDTSKGEIDHDYDETREPTVDLTLIYSIQEQWRRRQAWHRAEKSLTLQAKALCRRLADNGDKKEADKIYNAALGKGEHEFAADAMSAMLPLIEARDSIEKHRLAVEKRLTKLAKELPVAEWIASVRGVALLSLAAIVGEAADLSSYANPGKLWKRMGLAPYQGKSYSSWRRDGGLKADDWTEAGYSPKRRSVMFVIGGGIIGGMGHGKRPLVGEDITVREDWSYFEKLFVERIRYEAARDPEMLLEPTKEGKESYTKFAAMRAQRFVEKRFLRMLWQAWRGSPSPPAVCNPAMRCVGDSTNSGAA